MEFKEYQLAPVKAYQLTHEDVITHTKFISGYAFSLGEITFMSKYHVLREGDYIVDTNDGYPKVVPKDTFEETLL